ncbi:MAG: HutD family protein [Ruminococcaceae bacterium]|nr:HutD family protein [Oscillospiraceae bacterium]
MEPVLTLLTPADYVTTQWSGGSTTQLAIAPAGAVYAERDFLWRVSSATVELDESDFTALPDYRRFISTVRGDMTLRHNGGAELTLHPGNVHEFDGADDTHSRGRCTDFNLMLRKGRAEGTMQSLRVGADGAALVCPETALLYCASGSCTVRCGGKELRVAAGESALAEHAAGETLRLSSTDVETLLLAALIQ